MCPFRKIFPCSGCETCRLLKILLFFFGKNVFGRCGLFSVLFKYGNKALCESSLSSRLYIYITDDAEHDRADKVDYQILHCIDKSDIEVSAESERFTVHCNVGYILDNDGFIAVCRIEFDRRYGIYNKILLHIGLEYHIHSEFEE